METEKVKVMIDPYLSSSVEKVDPKNHRMVDVDKAFLKIRPDIMLFTHDHLDHYDPETVTVYLSSDKQMTVLAPESVWGRARVFGGDKNYVRVKCGTVWTEKDLRFTAVKADHSDAFAIGFVIEDMSDGKKYYITGDTLYNKGIFEDIPSDIYAVFLPINGVGNNMNMTDARDFVRRIGAKYCVPIHFGMFDGLDPTEFEAENKIIPEIYKEIKFIK